MVMGRREEVDIEESDQPPWRTRRTWAGPSSHWPTQTTTASSGGEREQIISRGRGRGCFYLARVGHGEW